jgi:hypothetical protein
MAYSGDEHKSNQHAPLGGITRRSFLGSSLAVAAAPAFASGEGTYEYRMVFNWNARQTILSISEQRRTTATTEKDSSVADSAAPWIVTAAWPLPKAAFGPRAGFRLKKTAPGDGTLYELSVSNCEFGRNRNRALKFELSSKGGGQFSIKMRTNLWSLTKSPSGQSSFSLGKRVLNEKQRLEAEKKPLFFSDFVQNRRDNYLYQWVANGRVASTFKLIFNGLVSTQAKDTQHGVFIGFSPTCAWHVDAINFRKKDPVSITAFEGEVRLDRLRFAWCNDLASAPSAFQAGTSGQAISKTQGVLVAAGDFRGKKASVRHRAGDHTLDLTPSFETLQQPVGNLAQDPQRPPSGGDPKPKPQNERFWIRAGHAPQRRKGRATTGMMETEVAWFDRWHVALGENGLDRCTVGTGVRGVLRQRIAVQVKDESNDSPELGEIETLFDADFSDEKLFRITSPVGQLRVAGVLPDQDASVDDTGAKLAEPWTSGRIFENRNGAALRLVTSRRAVKKKDARSDVAPVELRWFEVNVQIQECFQKLKDTDYSRLSFAPTSCVLVYAEGDDVPYGHNSFIRLNQQGAGPSAQIDLDRALLKASRAADLVHLTFRFRNLVLEFFDQTPRIVPLLDRCRVTRVNAHADTNEILDHPSQRTVINGSAETHAPLVQAEAVPHNVDTRATLVVEFPPLHMLEETVFRPNAPEPPAIVIKDKDKALFLFSDDLKVDLNDNSAVAAALDGINDPAKRVAQRMAIVDHYKSYADGATPPVKIDSFNTFSTKFKAATKYLKGPSADQKIYIGPIGLDPDVRAVMRATWQKMLNENIASMVDKILSDAKSVVPNIVNAARRRIEQGRGSALDLRIASHDRTFEGALALEMQVESAQPAYQLFRTFYREAMLDLYLNKFGDKVGLDGSLKAALKEARLPEKNWPSSLDVREIEFINHLDGDYANYKWVIPSKPISQARQKFVHAAYQVELSGKDPLPDLVEGRLSQPSRLAFTINCRDDLHAQRLSVSELDQGGGESQQNGRGQLQFSLDDLTRWSAFEMSVTRRARALVTPDATGRMGFLSRRLLNSDDNDQLSALGFPRGDALMASDWSAHLQTTLQNGPDPFETAIEIPARLILSPNQTAVFLTPQPLPSLLQPDANYPKMSSLWAARLSGDEGDPGIRAVHSPDLRPGVFNGWVHNAMIQKGTGGAPGAAGTLKNFALHGANPPPRGPLAPWFLDRHDSNAKNPSPYAYGHSYKNRADGSGYLSEDADGTPISQDSETAKLCAAIEARKEEGASRYALPYMIDQLCRRLQRRKITGNAYRFRTPLDAAIRHELVLLSSGFGMRVMGRRDPRGQIIGESQFEAAAHHRLLDIQAGSAIYRPQTLDVSALELTSLGGSLQVNASFQPPAGALLLNDTPLFDAMSVARYQQATVLGRDIYVEVMFKGFLLPFGHRASLVQVTERRFELDPGGSVTSYLVQRMYIQRGTKTERFPGLGQPYSGRQFPADAVTILTERTADIIDPYDDADGGFDTIGEFDAGPTGRVRLRNGENDVGLVFWPRTAKSPAANIRFDLQLDEHFSTLPLLFVDNTAANNPKTLENIATYYNQHICNPDTDNLQDPDATKPAKIIPARHISTLLFGGEKMRMADEEKSGSCSVETFSWTLALSGRVSGGVSTGDPAQLLENHIDLQTIDLTTGKFTFDPVLQGADRLPAYPTLSTARIFLRQNDQLTGVASPEPVRVQYDGRYVLDGLPQKQAPGQDVTKEAPVKGNRSEVFLTLIDHAKQSLGDKGDNSGGLYRPETTLVAFSRLNGPMGIGAPKEVTLFEPEIGRLRDSAVLFDLNLPSVPESAKGTTPATNAGPTSDGGASSKSSATDALTDAKELYKRYFSEDAKLLGLISFQELIQLVVELRGGGAEASDPRSGMPKLQELVQYGGGKVARSAAEGLDSATDFVREKIARPLSDTIEDILNGWDEINVQILEKQQDLKGLTTPVGLNQVLPGLYAALIDLRTSLNQSLAETDDIAFSLSLGEVYEAGRRLIDTVARILSEIDEIIEDAISSQVAVVVDLVSNVLGDLESALVPFAKSLLQTSLEDAGVSKNAAEKLARVVVGEGEDTKELIELAAKELAKYIVPPKGHDDAGAAYLYFPAPPLAVLGLGPEDRQLLENATRLSNQQVNEILQTLLVGLMSGKSFDETAREKAFKLGRKKVELASALGGLQIERIKQAIKQVREVVGSGEEKIKTIERDFKLYIKFLEDAGDRAGDALKDISRQLFENELKLFETIRTRGNAARRAIAKGEVLAAVQETLAFIELFSGPLPGLPLDKITKHAADILTKVGDVIHTGNLGAQVKPATISTEPCRLNDSFGVPESFEPALGSKTLGERVHKVHVALKDLTRDVSKGEEKLGEFLDDRKVRDVIADTALPQRLRNAGAKVSSTIEALHRATGEIFCDLYNDGLLASGIEKDWAALVEQVEAASSDQDVKTLSQVFQDVPARYEQLLRSRQQALNALTTHTKDIGKHLSVLVQSPDVLTLFGTGGIAGGLQQAAPVELDQLQKTAKAKLEAIQVETQALEGKLEGLLFDVAVQLHQYLKYVLGLTEQLETFVTSSIARINSYRLPVTLDFDGTAKPLTDTNAYLTGLGDVLAQAITDGKAAKNRLSHRQFSEIAADFEGQRLPMLEFLAPSVQVDGASLERLRMLQAEIEAVPAQLKDLLSDQLRLARTEVLKTLDVPAARVLQLDFNDKQGWLLDLYSTLKSERDRQYVQLSESSVKLLAGKILVEASDDRLREGIFPPADHSKLPQDNDQLAADLIWLQHLLKTPAGGTPKPVSNPENFAFFSQFFREWGAGTSTPFKIADQVGDLFKDILRGDVLKLLPVQQIRDEVENHILEMVPSKITRSYKYGTELPPQLESLTLGIFKPGPKSKMAIGMKFEIDLFGDGGLEDLSPTIDFQSIGSLGAFDIKLVGDLLDAITLHFSGATFETRSGQKPKFDIQYNDFTVGPALAFVEQLAAYLSPGGSGPYVTPTRGYPGIEAGYSLNVGIFSIGTLSFSNISLNASALLPFTNKPTRFRASLSRRDAPFTLSYAPWGGSGFFSIDADADGIVGFEASFEFGGAAAFAIGPLTGQGRLMAGFYIRQTKSGDTTVTEMAATFFVGGSANIWIFSFSSSLYVRLGMVKGNMTGLAVYTFSFSLGIKDFNFSVEWRKEEKKGFNGDATASLSGPRRTRFAGDGGAASSGTVIGVDTTCQSQKWDVYSTYFDTDLSQEDFLNECF